MEKISPTHVSLKPTSTATTLNSSSVFCPNLSDILELHGHRKSITVIGNKSLDKKSTLRCCQQQRATSVRIMNDANAPSSSPRVIKLEPIEATPESFRQFGQVIESGKDGDEYGPKDAQLDLTRGIPRFYIMHLEDRALKFSTITHHASVTQCLGSIGGHAWYLGVAKPSIVIDPNEIKGVNITVQSHCGHIYIPPNVDDVRVFRISGPKFLKLNKGTWHAGPLFIEKEMDFYNLELSNTNVVDHTTHSFVEKDNVIFMFDA